jgi:hypothetical protein
MQHDARQVTGIVKVMYTAICRVVPLTVRQLSNARRIASSTSGFIASQHVSPLMAPCVSPSNSTSKLRTASPCSGHRSDATAPRARSSVGGRGRAPVTWMMRPYVAVTIALSVKVNDGLVLASDSAVTIGAAANTQNVYNHADKVFNLVKGLPVGAVVFGSGNIGAASLTTIIKDLRRGLMGEDPARADLRVDRATYDLQSIAQTAKVFFEAERDRVGIPQGPTFRFGVMVGGYSAEVKGSELWSFSVDAGEGSGPVLSAGVDKSQLDYGGQIEAIGRLTGQDPGLQAALASLGVPDEIASKVAADLHRKLAVSLVQPAMPIQDAVDLADYLVQTSIGYSRFNVGWPSVGGPVEIATITRHEGFKWIKRKHFFRPELTPRLDP